MSSKNINTHELHALNHRKNKNNITERRCTDCGEWLEENTNNFYMMNKSKLEKGYQAKCKKCIIKRGGKYQKEHAEERSAYNKKLLRENPDYFHKKSKKWYNDNTEYSLQLTRKWQIENPEKAYQHSKKHPNHKITKEEWSSCKHYFGNACAYCGMTEQEHRKKYKQDLHKDHGIDGGRNDIKNCIPACKHCNSEKHETSINMWYNLNNPKFSQEKYHRIYMWYRYDCKKFIVARDRKVRNRLKKKFNVA